MDGNKIDVSIGDIKNKRNTQMERKDIQTEERLTNLQKDKR